MITGDFNFHLDNPSDRAAARFRVMLDVFDLKQHVKNSTHKNGHILDLVITRSGDQLVRNVRVSDLVMSDHCAAGLERTSVCFRKIRFIDRDQFVQDIKDLSLKNHQDFPACCLSTIWLLRQHSAFLIRSTHARQEVRPAAPWYSDSIREGKAEKRELKRRWRCINLTIDQEL